MTRARAAAGSLIFLLIAPGVAAGAVPWWLTDGWDASDPPLALQIVGGVLVAAGAAALISAFARFVFEGLGTPAPVAPTSELVVGGLYRYVRNPMYVAVTTTIVGQAALLGQAELLLYALAFMATVAAFVYGYEQPALSRQFGAQYDQYRRNVPAWIPVRPSSARRPSPRPASGRAGGTQAGSRQRAKGLRKRWRRARLRR